MVILDIGKVDVAEETASIDAHVYVSWFDQRLKTDEPDPPPIDWQKTWHPPFQVSNAPPDSCDDIRCQEFSRKTGQMFSWIFLHGPMHNRMILRQFPFDCNEIVVKVDATHTFLTADLLDFTFSNNEQFHDDDGNTGPIMFQQQYDPEASLMEWHLQEMHFERHTVGGC
jgi:hypothetical protein